MTDPVSVAKEIGYAFVGAEDGTIDTAKVLAYALVGDREPEPCGGGWVYYLERLEPRDDCIFDSWFLDSALALPLNAGVGDLLLGSVGPSTTACISSLGPAVGDVIILHCAEITLDSAIDDNHFNVTINGDVSQWAIPDDPNGAMEPIPAADWQYVTPTTTVSGLDHLEGKTVNALVDGRVVTDLVVTGGAVTLPFAGASIVVGLAYTGQIQTLYLTVEGLNRNTDQGKRKQITGVTVRVDNTRGTWVGKAFTDLDLTVPDELLYDTSATSLLYTGDARVLTVPDWNRKGEICIEQRDPLPSTVLGVVVEVTAGDTGQ